MNTLQNKMAPNMEIRNDNEQMADNDIDEGIKKRCYDEEEGTSFSSNNNSSNDATTTVSMELHHHPRFPKRKSSFLEELKKNKERNIPQITVQVENLTYNPRVVDAVSSHTSSTNGSASSSVLGLRRRRRQQQPDDTTAPVAAAAPNSNNTPPPSSPPVLQNISTEIKPYELTAWMGPSGSGKTSLTKCVAGLVDPTHIVHGSIRVLQPQHQKNPPPRNSMNENNNNNNTRAAAIGGVPKHMVGVVWQDDLLLSNLTVEESIYFAARLKTPDTHTNTAVRLLVQETMLELNLHHVATSPIYRLSGGERKRVAVAVELVVRPSLLLCDEPTSGLDATTAFDLISTFQALCTLGHSIVVVIHQPRTDIFTMFDHVLLLSRGELCYDGPTTQVRPYLESLTTTAVPSSMFVVQPLPPETGIADWIMDTIVADERSRQNQNENDHDDDDDGTAATPTLSLPAYWNKHMMSKKSTPNHPPLATDDGSLVLLPSSSSSSSSLRQQRHHKKYEASFRKEFVLLTNRISKQQRGEKLTKVALLCMVSYLLFTSFMWWDTPDTTTYIFERTSLLFFILIAQSAGIVNSSIAIFHRERALLQRERAKKMYRVLPFFLAKLISDMTNNILLPMIYGIITYWSAGLNPSPTVFCKYLLGYYACMGCAQSLAFLISITISNINLTMILATPIVLFSFIAGGFYIPFNRMHIAIKSISYISFARYAYSALLINEFDGRLIPCEEDNGNNGNITASDVYSTNNNNDTATTTYVIDSGSSGGEIYMCPLPGAFVYEGIGLDGIFRSYWFNVGMLVIFQLIFTVGAYVQLRRSR